MTSIVRVLTVFLLAFSAAVAAPRPTATIHRLAPDRKPPVVDGRMDEALWHQVEALDRLTASKESFDITHVDIWRGTTVRACWDDRALYLLIVCRTLERNPVTLGEAPDDDRILDGDWVGLSISTGPDAAPCRLFVVDPRNLRWDALESANGRRDATGNPKWQSAVTFRDDRYIAEFAIPWASAGGKPTPDEKRRVNVMRHCKVRRHQFWAWAPVPGMKPVKDLQGVWRFSGPFDPPPDPWKGDAMRGRNPDAIADIVEGRRDTASAAWWGFDSEDTTRYLQAAIDSGAKKVIVPNMGRDWVVTPIVPASHQELFFEPGVVVMAKKGAFRRRHDALIRARNTRHMTLTGYGATLQMRKADYQSDAYHRSGWRHGIDLESCSDVVIQGLTVRESGGDGLMLGSWGRGYNRDVVIRDCDFDANHRQGISIISAENLLIENCLFRNTIGTGPSAGIDFEPDEPEERLVNCVVRRCVAENNDGTGFTISTTKLAATAPDVSILLEDCLVRGGNRFGFNVSGPTRHGPQGTIEFRNCHVENVRKMGVRILDKASDRIDLRFVNCSWRNVGASDANTGDYRNVPILFHLRERRFAPRPGGVTFTDCVVIDDQDRPFIAYGTPVKEPPALIGITGNLTVTNPHGARAELGAAEPTTELRVTSRESR